MLIFAIFTALVLGLPILGVWPIYTTDHSGQGASNTMFAISMPSHGPEVYGGSIAHWRAVFAEEVVEHYLRWLVAFAVAWPIVLLAEPEPSLVSNMLAIIGTIMLCLWSAPALGTRMIEYVGKAAFSIERGWPVDSEAGMLATAYPEAFGGMTPEQIRPGLIRAAPIARVLLGLLSLRMRWLPGQ